MEDKNKILANSKYLHICDNAFFSDMGKLNIIGIFKNVYTVKLPVSHPTFSVVSSIDVTLMEGPTNVIASIIDPNNKELSNRIKMDTNIDKNQEELNTIFNFTNTKFKKEGQHVLSIRLNNIEVVRKEINVIKTK